MPASVLSMVGYTGFSMNDFLTLTKFNSNAGHNSKKSENQTSTCATDHSRNKISFSTNKFTCKIFDTFRLSRFCISF